MGNTTTTTGMGTHCGTMRKDLRKGIDDAMNGLEEAADEIRVKLHLAGMDLVKDWETNYEPRLFAARAHAKEATEASKEAIEETIKAFREFGRAM
jgi:hypothetical protein